MEDDDDDDDKDDDNVPEDHVLDGGGESWHLPGYVGLPAAPGLGEVLQDHPGLVLLDALTKMMMTKRVMTKMVITKRMMTYLRHHVHYVQHDGCPQLEVVVAAGPLLGDGVGDGGARPGALVTALEVTGQEVAQPPEDEQGQG